MREGIGKYRGKSLEAREWVYGYYVYWTETESHCIVNEECVGLNIGIIVDPETVGELVHTNTEGVDIYEGDWTEASWGEQGLVEFESFIYAKVECRVSDDIKPVGNIHDNPQPWEEQA